MTTRNQLANQVKQKLNQPQSDDAIITQLKAMGFSDDYIESPRRLVASLSGREKTGKTHFSLTAPDPIIFINVDIGTEGVVGKFQEKGKQVLIFDVRVPKEATKDVYQPMWANVKQCIQKAYKLAKGTVVWDTATEIYELARLAHFGKLTQVLPHNYTEVNNEWRELLRLAYDAKLNTVFIHKMKPKWVNNTRTADYELSGFQEMDYLSQINLVTYREDSDGSPAFSVFVKDCRQNPNIGGQILRGEMCNFEFLLSLVHDK
jgi:hypothetical protein